MYIHTREKYSVLTCVKWRRRFGLLRRLLGMYPLLHQLA